MRFINLTYEEFRQEMKQKEEDKLVGDICFLLKIGLTNILALVVEALERQPGSRLRSSKGTVGALGGITYM